MISGFAYITTLLLLVATLCVNGLKHHLHITNDERTIFKIETFGFKELATIQLFVHNFKVKSRPSSNCDLKCQNELDSIEAGEIRLRRKLVNTNDKSKNKAIFELQSVEDTKSSKDSKNTKKSNARYGFVLRKSDSESDAQQDLEVIVEKNQCIFDKPNDGWEDIVDFIDTTKKDSSRLVMFEHLISAREVGLYSLIFAHCDDNNKVIKSVSFHLDAYFVNPGPNYLSVGDQPLPMVYLGYFILFSLLLVWWQYLLCKAPSKQATVHRIHYMMLGLLVLKCITLVLESIRLHYISLYGEAENWSILYYIFAFFKGIMLFTVILLIGSGWSLIKSYLNSREKNIIMVVLILQVIDNIAMIVLEETSPGSQRWLLW
jgi:hypothetical protein